MMIKKLLTMTLFAFVGHAALAQVPDSTATPVTDTTRPKQPPTERLTPRDTVLPGTVPPSTSPISKPGARPAKPASTNPTAAYDALNLANRPNDHFLIELGYTNWVGKPDTIRTSGIGRSFAFYFMLDFPFKTDPHWSIGAGLGIGVENIYFNKQEVLVEANNATLAFPDRTNTDHFKKYKLVNTYLEVPLELRYCFKPENPNKSWKIAIGAKPGLMLSAYTKGKNLLNNAGQLEQAYIEKNSSKKYFNTGRLATSLRVSYGFIGLFGQYQVSSLIKNGAGPTINPYVIGIVLSGL